MAKVQNLRLRGKTYWYHRYIPKDVREPFNGRAQVWISLKTQDAYEAKRLCLQLTLDHDEKIETFRRGQDAVITFFTDEYIDSLAQAWAADWLHQDGEARMAGQHEAKYVFLLGYSHTPESLRSLLLRESRDGWDGITPFIATDWLLRQSVDMPRSSEPFQRLCYRIRQAALQALDSLKLRSEGVPVESPPRRKVERPIPKQGIEMMLEPWKLRQKPKDSSVREFERAVARFNERHAGVSVDEIETRHIVEYRDFLTAEGLAAATVEKHLNGIKALLGVAVERSLLNHNPASRIRPPKAGRGEEQDREPFSVEQLQMLFRSPIYTGGRASLFNKITRGGPQRGVQNKDELGIASSNF